MTWFRSKSARLARLESDVGTLSEFANALKKELEGLAGEIAPLRADVDLQWEKVNRALGRLAKRQPATEVDDQQGNGPTSPLDQQTQAILDGWIPGV